MKYIVFIMGLLLTGPLWALDISKEGQQEAQLFNTFLKAIYVYQDDAPRAYQTLQQALKLAPQSKYIRRLLVQTALFMGKPELAEPYADYINNGENEAEDFSVYAAYQMQRKNPQAALEFYEKALALAPDDNELAYQYLVLLSAYDESKMIAVMNDMAQTRPEIAAQAYTQIGKLYVRRKQFDKALPYLDKAVRADPADPAPRLAKADMYEQTSQYFLMLHEFEELEKMGYGNAGMFSRMAAVFMVVQDIPKAENYFLKARAHDATDPASNYFLSLLAEQKGDLDKAIFYLQESADYPTNASRWLQVGFLQQKLGRPQDSLHTLEQAYKRFEDNVEIAFFYGLMLNDAKEFKKSARVFKKLVAARPEYTDARLHYAYALESLKKYDDMEAQLKAVLAQQSQNAPALNLWAYSLAQRQTRLEEAEEYITRALAVSPQDVSFQDTLGWVYVQQGKLDAAEKILLSFSSDTLKRYPEIAYHIGVLRYRQGRPEEALNYLGQARAGWPAAEELYRRLSR